MTTYHYLIAPPSGSMFGFADDDTKTNRRIPVIAFGALAIGERPVVVRHAGTESFPMRVGRAVRIGVITNVQRFDDGRVYVSDDARSWLLVPRERRLQSEGRQAA